MEWWSGGKWAEFSRDATVGLLLPGGRSCNDMDSSYIENIGGEMD